MGAYEQCCVLIHEGFWYEARKFPSPRSAGDGKTHTFIRYTGDDSAKQSSIWDLGNLTATGTTVDDGTLEGCGSESLSY